MENYIIIIVQILLYWNLYNNIYSSNIIILDFLNIILQAQILLYQIFLRMKLI